MSEIQNSFFHFTSDKSITRINEDMEIKCLTNITC